MTTELIDRQLRDARFEHLDLTGAAFTTVAFAERDLDVPAPGAEAGP